MQGTGRERDAIGAGESRAPRHTFRSCRLLERIDLTASLASFRFEFEEGVPEFEPGQYLTLGFALASGKLIWRAYSIASPPEEKRYVELYIRLALLPVKGRLTSELWRMQPGASMLWRAPRGTFTFDDRKPNGTLDDRTLVFVGGGTGLAPFRACVLHRRHLGSKRKLVLCHGASHVAELGYRELFLELEAQSRVAENSNWNFRYLPTISRPDVPVNAGWGGQTGRVETLLRAPMGASRSPVEDALEGALVPESTCLYVCGFQGTVDAVRAVVEPLGFRTRKNPRPDGSYDLHSESYG